MSIKKNKHDAFFLNTVFVDITDSGNPKLKKKKYTFILFYPLQ